MNALIAESMIPMVVSIGFLKHPYQEVVDAFVHWTRQLQQSVETEILDEDILTALSQLQPLTSTPRKWLFVQTIGEWVACFDNVYVGSDHLSTVSYLSQVLSCRGAIVRYRPHTFSKELGVERGMYGSTQLLLFADQKTDFVNFERSISVLYEAGRWRFDAVGKVQEFEDVGRYSARQIINRFTIQMLLEYCSAIGIDVDSRDFYCNDSTLVTSHDPLPESAVVVTLKEARERLEL